MSVQELTDTKVIPEAQASSITTPTEQPDNNSEIVQLSLAIAGPVMSFGAVWN